VVLSEYSGFLYHQNCLTWLIEFAGNYTIGNIQVCYAAALPVSIVERS
jgi:hypothetical protein